jgi:hypothetical protein
MSAFTTSTLGTRTIWVMPAKSLASVVGHALEQPGVDRMRGRGGNADGQAVRRGLGDMASAPMLPPAPGLFSTMTVPSASLHALGQGARRDVHRAARGIGDDEADGFGCVLRLRAGGKQRGCGGAGKEEGAGFMGPIVQKKKCPTQAAVCSHRAGPAGQPFSSPVLVGLRGEGVGKKLFCRQAALAL